MVKGAEILEVLHGLPAARQYLFSLYECRYSVFFQSLGKDSVACGAVFIIPHSSWIALDDFPHTRKIQCAEISVVLGSVWLIFRSFFV